MKPMTIDMFQTYYAEYEPDNELMDWNDSEYAEWTCGFAQCYGMRLRGTDRMHGIVRLLTQPEGFIYEGTFKNDSELGMGRFIWQEGSTG